MPSHIYTCLKFVAIFPIDFERFHDAGRKNESFLHILS